ncbi:hypothetical protein FA95DRAFT_1554041 [Auriscalpium vulgare]|uniref:Uncharacterized protein n=1 Tax=Auriscalpium vulgare TaxID=40419 RepID=A0ACB8S806_9AGAM|nr:hypothetical protein FA95DRAFT_1554041 [Auriscalpium vulgare]
MNSCPPEIHAQIFSLACTDDGFTGRSLSHVSRYVRQASAPFQWQSLVISGARKTKKFAELLDELSSRNPDPCDHISTLFPRPITHLFVSNRMPEDARERRYNEMGATRDMAERRKIALAFDEEADSWAAAIRRIFSYAAGTVRTLTMMCYDIHVSPNGRLFFSDLKRYFFPMLEELTIRGGFDTRLRDYDGASHHDDDDDDAARVEASAPTLPSLRRLHLISPISFDLFLLRLRPLAPGISHVRLSELLPFDYDMTRQLYSELAARALVPPRLPGLRDCMWSAEPVARPVDWVAFLPQETVLAQLVLQPSQLPREPDRMCGCCTGYYRVDDMTRLLKEMAREAFSDQYVFLPAGKRRGLGYAFEEGMADWRSRAIGGKGCWKERGEVDIDFVQEPEEHDQAVWSAPLRSSKSILRNWTMS